MSERKHSARLAAAQGHRPSSQTQSTTSLGLRPFGYLDNLRQAIVTGYTSINERAPDSQRRSFRTKRRVSTAISGASTGISSNAPNAVENLQDVICAVCCGRPSAAPSMSNTSAPSFVTCASCGVSVHSACYGLNPHTYIAGTWKCDPCAAYIQESTDPSVVTLSTATGLTIPQSIECALCSSPGGALRLTEDEKWVHVTCALWCPELHFPHGAQNTGLPVIGSTHAIEQWRWRLTCSICQRNKGVCIPCAAPGCKQYCHPSCALATGYRVHLIPAHVASSGGELADVSTYGGVSTSDYESGGEEHSTALVFYCLDHQHCTDVAAFAEKRATFAAAFPHLHAHAQTLGQQTSSRVGSDSEQSTGTSTGRGRHGKRTSGGGAASAFGISVGTGTRVPVEDRMSDAETGRESGSGPSMGASTGASTGAGKRGAGMGTRERTKASASISTSTSVSTSTATSTPITAGASETHTDVSAGAGMGTNADTGMGTRGAGSAHMRKTQQNGYSQKPSRSRKLSSLSLETGKKSGSTFSGLPKRQSSPSASLSERSPFNSSHITTNSLSTAIPTNIPSNIPANIVKLASRASRLLQERLKSASKGRLNHETPKGVSPSSSRSSSQPISPSSSLSSPSHLQHLQHSMDNTTNDSTNTSSTSTPTSDTQTSSTASSTRTNAPLSAVTSSRTSRSPSRMRSVAHITLVQPAIPLPRLGDYTQPTDGMDTVLNQLLPAPISSEFQEIPNPTDSGKANVKKTKASMKGASHPLSRHRAAASAAKASKDMGALPTIDSVTALLKLLESFFKPVDGDDLLRIGRYIPLLQYWIESPGALLCVRVLGDVATVTVQAQPHALSRSQSRSLRTSGSGSGKGSSVGKVGDTVDQDGRCVHCRGETPTTQHLGTSQSTTQQPGAISHPSQLLYSAPALPSSSFTTSSSSRPPSASFSSFLPSTLSLRVPLPALLAYGLPVLLAPAASETVWRAITHLLRTHAPACIAPLFPPVSLSSSSLSTLAPTLLHFRLPGYSLPLYRALTTLPTVAGHAATVADPAMVVPPRALRHYSQHPAMMQTQSNTPMATLAQAHTPTGPHGYTTTNNSGIPPGAYTPLLTAAGTPMQGGAATHAYGAVFPGSQHAGGQQVPGYTQTGAMGSTSAGMGTGIGVNTGMNMGMGMGGGMATSTSQYTDPTRPYSPPLSPLALLAPSAPSSTSLRHIALSMGLTVAPQTLTAPASASAGRAAATAAATGAATASAATNSIITGAVDPFNTRAYPYQTLSKLVAAAPKLPKEASAAVFNSIDAPLPPTVVDAISNDGAAASTANNTAVGSNGETASDVVSRSTAPVLLPTASLTPTPTPTPTSTPAYTPAPSPAPSLGPVSTDVSYSSSPPPSSSLLSSSSSSSVVDILVATAHPLSALTPFATTTTTTTAGASAAAGASMGVGAGLVSQNAAWSTTLPNAPLSTQQYPPTSAPYLPSYPSTALTPSPATATATASVAASVAAMELAQRRKLLLNSADMPISAEPAIITAQLSFAGRSVLVDFVVAPPGGNAYAGAAASVNAATSGSGSGGDGSGPGCDVDGCGSTSLLDISVSLLPRTAPIRMVPVANTSTHTSPLPSLSSSPSSSAPSYALSALTPEAIPHYTHLFTTPPASAALTDIMAAALGDSVLPGQDMLYSELLLHTNGDGAAVGGVGVWEAKSEDVDGGDDVKGDAMSDDSGSDGKNSGNNHGHGSGDNNGMLLGELHVLPSLNTNSNVDTPSTYSRHGIRDGAAAASSVSTPYLASSLEIATGNREHATLLLLQRALKRREEMTQRTGTTTSSNAHSNTQGHTNAMSDTHTSRPSSSSSSSLVLPSLHSMLGTRYSHLLAADATVSRNKRRNNNSSSGSGAGSSNAGGNSKHSSSASSSSSEASLTLYDHSSARILSVSTQELAKKHDGLGEWYSLYTSPATPTAAPAAHTTAAATTTAVMSDGEMAQLTEKFPSATIRMMDDPAAMSALITDGNPTALRTVLGDAVRDPWGVLREHVEMHNVMHQYQDCCHDRDMYENTHSNATGVSAGVSVAGENGYIDLYTKSSLCCAQPGPVALAHDTRASTTASSTGNGNGSSNQRSSAHHRNSKPYSTAVTLRDRDRSLVLSGDGDAMEDAEDVDEVLLSLVYLQHLLTVQSKRVERMKTVIRARVRHCHTIAYTLPRQVWQTTVLSQYRQAAAWQYLSHRLVQGVRDLPVKKTIARTVALVALRVNILARLDALRGSLALVKSEIARVKGEQYEVEEAKAELEGEVTEGEQGPGMGGDMSDGGGDEGMGLGVGMGVREEGEMKMDAMDDYATSHTANINVTAQTSARGNKSTGAGTNTGVSALSPTMTDALDEDPAFSGHSPTSNHSHTGMPTLEDVDSGFDTLSTGSSLEGEDVTEVEMKLMADVIAVLQQCGYTGTVEELLELFAEEDAYEEEEEEEEGVSARMSMSDITTEIKTEPLQTSFSSSSLPSLASSPRSLSSPPSSPARPASPSRSPSPQTPRYYLRWLQAHRLLLLSLIRSAALLLERVVTVAEQLALGTLPSLPGLTAADCGMGDEPEGDPVGCSVCFGVISQEDNPILTCEVCKTAVHRRCYGISRSFPATTEWTCASCVAHRRAPTYPQPPPVPTCALCTTTWGCLKPAELAMVRPSTLAIAQNHSAITHGHSYPHNHTTQGQVGSGVLSSTASSNTYLNGSTGMGMSANVGVGTAAGATSHTAYTPFQHTAGISGPTTIATGAGAGMGVAALHPLWVHPVCALWTAGVSVNDAHNVSIITGVPEAIQLHQRRQRALASKREGACKRENGVEATYSSANAASSLANAPAAGTSLIATASTPLTANGGAVVARAGAGSSLPTPLNTPSTSASTAQAPSASGSQVSEPGASATFTSTTQEQTPTPTLTPTQTQAQPQAGDSTDETFSSALSAPLVCALCNIDSGVTVPCATAHCAFNAHALCAWKAGCAMSAKATPYTAHMRVYCPLHTPNPIVEAVHDVPAVSPDPESTSPPVSYPLLFAKLYPLLHTIAHAPFLEDTPLPPALPSRLIEAVERAFLDSLVPSTPPSLDPGIPAPAHCVAVVSSGVRFVIPLSILHSFRLLCQQEVRLRHRPDPSICPPRSRRKRITAPPQSSSTLTPTQSSDAAATTPSSASSSALAASSVEPPMQPDTYEHGRCAVCFKSQADFTAEGVWCAAQVTLMETHFHNCLHMHRVAIAHYNHIIKQQYYTTLVHAHNRGLVPAPTATLLSALFDDPQVDPSRPSLSYVHAASAVDIDALSMSLPAPVAAEFRAAVCNIAVPHFDNPFVLTRTPAPSPASPLGLPTSTLPSASALALPPGAEYIVTPWELYHAARRRLFSIFGSDRMLKCADCGICVHQSCYGVTQAHLEALISSSLASRHGGKAEEPVWRCLTCVSVPVGGNKTAMQSCILCPRRGGALRPVFGAVGEKYAHITCALWAHGVSFDDAATRNAIIVPKGLVKAAKARRCYVCLRPGATVDCADQCGLMFHPLCNMLAGGYANITLDVPTLAGATAIAFCIRHTPLHLSRTGAHANSEFLVLAAAKDALDRALQHVRRDEAALSLIQHQVCAIITHLENYIKQQLLPYIPRRIGSLALGVEIGKVMRQMTSPTNTYPALTTAASSPPSAAAAASPSQTSPQQQVPAPSPEDTDVAADVDTRTPTTTTDVSAGTAPLVATSISSPASTSAATSAATGAGADITSPTSTTAAAAGALTSAPSASTTLLSPTPSSLPSSSPIAASASADRYTPVTLHPGSLVQQLLALPSTTLASLATATIRACTCLCPNKAITNAHTLAFCVSCGLPHVPLQTATLAHIAEAARVKLQISDAPPTPTPAPMSTSASVSMPMPTTSPSQGTNGHGTSLGVSTGGAGGAQAGYGLGYGYNYGYPYPPGVSSSPTTLSASPSAALSTAIAGTGSGLASSPPLPHNLPGTAGIAAQLSRTTPSQYSPPSTHSATHSVAQFPMGTQHTTSVAGLPLPLPPSSTAHPAAAATSTSVSSSVATAAANAAAAAVAAVAATVPGVAALPPLPAVPGQLPSNTHLNTSNTHVANNLPTANQISSYVSTNSNALAGASSTGERSGHPNSDRDGNDRAGSNGDMVDAGHTTSASTSAASINATTSSNDVAGVGVGSGALAGEGMASELAGVGASAAMTASQNSSPLPPTQTLSSHDLSSPLHNLTTNTTLPLPLPLPMPLPVGATNALSTAAAVASNAVPLPVGSANAPVGLGMPLSGATTDATASVASATAAGNGLGVAMGMGVGVGVPTGALPTLPAMSAAAVTVAAVPGLPVPATIASSTLPPSILPPAALAGLPGMVAGLGPVSPLHVMPTASPLSPLPAVVTMPTASTAPLAAPAATLGASSAAFAPSTAGFNASTNFPTSASVLDAATAALAASSTAFTTNTTANTSAGAATPSTMASLSGGPVVASVPVAIPVATVALPMGGVGGMGTVATMGTAMSALGAVSGMGGVGMGIGAGAGLNTGIDGVDVGADASLPLPEFNMPPIGVFGSNATTTTTTMGRRGPVSFDSPLSPTTGAHPPLPQLSPLAPAATAAAAVPSLLKPSRIDTQRSTPASQRPPDSRLRSRTASRSVARDEELGWPYTFPHESSAASHGSFRERGAALTSPRTPVSSLRQDGSTSPATANGSGVWAPPSTGRGRKARRASPSSTMPMGVGAGVSAVTSPLPLDEEMYSASTAEVSDAPTEKRRKRGYGANNASHVHTGLPHNNSGSSSGSRAGVLSHEREEKHDEQLAPRKKRAKVTKPFNVGDRPFLEEDGQRHLVVIKKVDMSQVEPRYEIHYHQWSSKYDKWVSHHELSL